MTPARLHREKALTPLTELPERHILSGQEVIYFGRRYVVPVVVDWPETVGGALIPGLMSPYLFVKHRLWVRGLLAITCLAALCHLLAQPVPGLGIALRVFVPAIASALVALLLSLRRAAPLAYIGGSLGTLVGADLLNLGRVQGLGAQDQTAIGIVAPLRRAFHNEALVSLAVDPRRVFP